MWGEKPFRIWGTELFRVRGAEPVGTEVCTEPVGAATGRSLGMDVTVSELMELFLQSPLVTWVSAPGSQPELVPGLLSHPPRVTADLTRRGGGCGWQAVRGLRGLSRCSQLGSGQWPGVRRCFQLWSRCSLCRTPQCPSPGLWVHLSLPGCWAARPGVDRVDVVAVAPVD